MILVFDDITLYHELQCFFLVDPLLLEITVNQLEQTVETLKNEMKKMKKEMMEELTKEMKKEMKQFKKEMKKEMMEELQKEIKKLSEERKDVADHDSTVNDENLAPYIDNSNYSQSLYGNTMLNDENIPPPIQYTSNSSTMEDEYDAPPLPSPFLYNGNITPTNYSYDHRTTVHPSQMSATPFLQQPKQCPVQSPPSNSIGPLVMPPKQSSQPSLPSCEIQKSWLIPVEDVLCRYQKLKTESKVGTLAVKLAREAIFGVDVMSKCTVVGCRELPALPNKELGYLKKILFQQFPAYWRNPACFEPLWTTSVNSINQCCKVLRQNQKRLVYN